MPRGSTNTTCVGCKAVIAVATKTCKFCKTLQPRKQRLVEKLNTLGYRAMVFLSKPGKKPSTWKTNVAHPRWHLSDQAAKCLYRMKALYEVLVDGWTNPQPSSSPEDRPSSSTYAVLLPTSPAIQPSTGPATPAAQTKRTAAEKKKQDVSPRKKLKKKNPQDFEECSHKIVGGEHGKKWHLQWVEKDNTTTEEQQD
ncbi:hypothetical protein NQZ68_035374 [Dissostichus eleginoides]|nr:hypothetical protein NQZ68_035374 [Dissostichus eleginoides]